MTIRTFSQAVAFDLFNASSWVLKNLDTGEKMLASDLTKKGVDGAVWWSIDNGRVTPLDLHKKQIGPIFEIQQKRPGLTLEERVKRLGMGV